MVNKGDIKTQQQYEDEVELRGLLKEAFLKAEMTKKEAICLLILILGFGKTIAATLISEWSQETIPDKANNETHALKKRRIKRQQSLMKKIMVKRYVKKSIMIPEGKPERMLINMPSRCSNCKLRDTCSVWKGWESIKDNPGKQ